MDALDQKYETLLEFLRSLDSALLAYSGGVDSTFLLKAAVDSGMNYLAVTAVSPTMPSTDRRNAQDIVAELGANFEMINSDEMEDENFVSNPVDRCFHCKSNLFDKLTALAKKRDYKVVLDGSNMDDLGDYRPGMEAKKKFQVVSPLIEVGVTKDEIREISRRLNLKTWDRPASPCLSSRFPYGERIDLKGLDMVERAELKLKDLDFRVVRVRKDGDTARIELSPEDIPRLMEDRVRDVIVPFFKEVGFVYVTLDLEGFQSGKLNRLVAD